MRRPYLNLAINQRFLMLFKLSHCASQDSNVRRDYA